MTADSAQIGQPSVQCTVGLYILLRSLLGIVLGKSHLLTVQIPLGEGREAAAEPVLFESQLSEHVFQQERLPKAQEQGNLQTPKAALFLGFALF